MARKLFTPENWMKLGAGLLALLLWVNVAFRSFYEYTLTVRLNLGQVPPKLILSDPIPDQVRARAEASGRDLFLLIFSQPQLVINGSGLRRGSNTVSLKATSLGIPKGVTLKNLEVIEPKVVSVELDRIQTKEVKVNQNVEMTLREGWIIVGNPRIEPAAVTVSGPYQYVHQIQQVDTDTIRMDQVTENIDANIPLVSEDFNVTFNPGTVKYTAQVERLAERRIENIPVVLLRVPAHIEAVLDEPFITLTVQGGESQVSRLTKQDIQVTLDYRKIERRPKRKFAATIKVPENIKWVKAEPKTFSLKEKIILKRNLRKRKNIDK